MCGGDQMQSHAIVVSEKEGYTLNGVFEEESQLQQQEENRLKRLRDEIDELEQKSRSYTDSYCSCCGVRLGVIINRGASCPLCSRRVCKQHRVDTYDLDKSWTCSLCDMKITLCINEETLSMEQNALTPVHSDQQGTTVLKRYSLPETAMLHFMITDIATTRERSSSLLKSTSYQDITGDHGTTKGTEQASNSSADTDDMTKLISSNQSKHPRSGGGYRKPVVRHSKSSATFPQQSRGNKKRFLEMTENELRDLTKMNTKINRGCELKLKKATVDTPEHIGDLRVMIQFVPDTNKSGKEKGRGSLNVWIQQARGLLASCDQGTYLLCTLLPRGKYEKFKSVVVQGGTNPTYNTMYQFDKVTDVELSYDRVLEITIWEPHRNTNEFVGGVRLGPKPQAGNKNKWMDSGGSEVIQWEEMMADPNQWIDAWHHLRHLMKR